MNGRFAAATGLRALQIGIIKASVATRHPAFGARVLRWEHKLVVAAERQASTIAESKVLPLQPCSITLLAVSLIASASPANATFNAPRRPRASAHAGSRGPECAVHGAVARDNPRLAAQRFFCSQRSARAGGRRAGSPAQAGDLTPQISIGRGGIALSGVMR